MAQGVHNILQEHFMTSKINHNQTAAISRTNPPVAKPTVVPKPVVVAKKAASAEASQGGRVRSQGEQSTQQNAVHDKANQNTTKPESVKTTDVKRALGASLKAQGEALAISARKQDPLIAPNLNRAVVDTLSSQVGSLSTLARQQ
jgi:hypothetical protein